jgi:prophage antirepressor-like protein|nr:MAG TPA: repressor domain protein [Caudoviricetes sp.]
MENNIQLFENPEFGQVRVLLQENGEPLFCLTDVCNALELNSGDVRKRLTDEVVSIHPISDSLGRQQKTNFINEDGLYDVVLDSRKENAKRLRKWVTSEVLPSIRKTGSYSLKPMTHIQMLAAQAQAMVELEQRQLEQAQQISLQEARLKVVEKKNEELEKERLLFEGKNFNFPLSQESLPEVSLRDKIRGLVNKFASINQVDHNIVWNKVYQELYYRYGISVRSYKRDKRQTYLDVLTQHNKLQQVYNVISFMVSEAKK